MIRESLSIKQQTRKSNIEIYCQDENKNKNGQNTLNIQNQIENNQINNKQIGYGIIHSINNLGYR